MTRYHLLAEVDGATIEVELDAPDAGGAVARLVELVEHGHGHTAGGHPAYGTIRRVHARPIDD